MLNHYRHSESPIHSSPTRGTSLPQHLASTTGVASGGGARMQAPASALAEPQMEPYTSGLPTEGT
jgi:hypothetical protein